MVALGSLPFHLHLRVERGVNAIQRIEQGDEAAPQDKPQEGPLLEASHEEHAEEDGGSRRPRHQRYRPLRRAAVAWDFAVEDPGDGDGGRAEHCQSPPVPAVELPWKGKANRSRREQQKEEESGEGTADAAAAAELHVAPVDECAGHKVEY